MRNLIYIFTLLFFLTSCFHNKQGDQVNNDGMASIEEVSSPYEENEEQSEDHTQSYDYEDDETTSYYHEDDTPSYFYEDEDEEEQMTDEERYFAQFSNFEPSSSDTKGVVVYEGSGDYYIIETNRGYTIAERYSGWLYEGHTLYGQLNSFGFKYVIDLNRDSEVKLYLEDYMLSKDQAIEWMGEHHHLNYRDQSDYDSYNSDW